MSVGHSIGCQLFWPSSGAQLLVALGVLQRSAALALNCLATCGHHPIGQAPGSDIFQSALGCSVLGCPSTQLRWPLYVLILILTNARLRRSAAQALGLPTSRAWTRPLWCSTLALSRPYPSVLSGDQLLWRPASGTRHLQHSPAVLCAQSLPALDRSGLQLLRSSAAPVLGRVGS